LVRDTPDGGARQPFAAVELVRRAGSRAIAGKPVLALMLNGAQGDDDEAHGGHFALVTGRVGGRGEIADWLVGNFYPLDVHSEKGIIAGFTPLDHYLGDLNSGQSWYRPSYLLVAVLDDERPAALVQAALARMFNQYYRGQLAYGHATMNCTGISVDVLRCIGWSVPASGPAGRVLALGALPWVAWRERSVRKGRDAFEYLTEDGTRLLPALAFEQVGARMLGLARGAGEAATSPSEAMLASAISSMWFVRMPQIPSSRAFGSWPITGLAEFRSRVPADPAERTVVPVPAREFPDALRERDLAPLPWTRGRIAVAAMSALIVAGLLALIVPAMLALAGLLTSP
jgi:hypothetical protein